MYAKYAAHSVKLTLNRQLSVFIQIYGNSLNSRVNHMVQLGYKILDPNNISQPYDS